MPQYELGQWLPDLPVVSLPGLRLCSNAIPTARGYRPFPSPGLVSGKSALASECRGAFSGESENGTQFIVAGTDSNSSNPKLYFVFGSTVDWLDATPATALSTIDTTAKWDFDQYGNEVFAVAKGVDPQYVDVTNDPGPTNRFADLPSGASQATTCAVFKNFLILGNLVGRGSNASAIGTRGNALHWSAVGNMTGTDSWPQVGTATASDVQSDWQLLDGAGGSVTQIKPGGEYCAVFQERATWRMDYIGAPNVFSFRLIESSIGCSVPRSAISVNNVVYFLSNQGFMAFDGSGVRSIGTQRVDRTFLDQFDRVNSENVFAAHSPESQCVFWGLSDGSGYPQTLYGYQYERDQWFTVSSAGLRLQAIFQALEPNVDGQLDYPPYSTQNMDTGSDLAVADLDRLGLTQGRTVLGYFDQSNKLGMFSGFDTPMQMSFQTGDFEMPDTNRAVLNYIRPIHDGGSMTVLASGRNTMSESDSYKLLRDAKSNGVFLPSPGARVGGRYLSAVLATNAGEPAENVYGFDADIRLGAAKR